jgi:hypothetical protein
MGKTSMVIFVALLTCLCTSICYAQCADGFQSYNLHCSGPEGCEDDVYVFYPIESQYGVHVVCGAVDCCGQLITSCYGSGNCEPKVFKNREVMKQLSQLSETSDVLITDCEGRYTLFEPSRQPRMVVRSIALGNRMLVNDHILR